MSEVDTPSLGRGDVIIKLNKHGEKILKPSIGAMKHLSRRYGGLALLLEQLGRLNFEAVCDVVEIGAFGGVMISPKQREKLMEDIYDTGLSADTGGLAPMCIDFVASLLRGGRAQPNEEEQKSTLEESLEGNVTTSAN